ncbi:MAG: hypothetical protein U0575_07525 [Phycisphaerales bacterium]
MTVSAPAAAGLPAPSGSASLIVSREDDTFAPNVAFRAEIELALDDPTLPTAISVFTGGGAAAALAFEKVDARWFHAWSYGSFDEIKSALNGTWTIEIMGSVPSVSTFTFAANALEQVNFFESPQVTHPVDGAPGVLPTVVTTWLPPTAGPFPAYILDAWIDYGAPDGPGSSPGPAEFLDTSSTSWDPEGLLLPGLSRFTVEYGVAAPPNLVGPLIVTSGAMRWSTPRIAPPGYPAPAPLIALTGRTRIAFTVVPCPDSADLDCDGAVSGADLGLLLANWGNAGTGDVNHDGVVDGADLGVLLGSWTG